MIQWHIVDSATYRNGTKQLGHMYFISDTREIYRGEEPFTESVILYNGTLPTSYAINRLYVDSTTLAGYIHNGTEWKSVIKPVEDTFDPESGNPVSAKAIAAYVAAEMAKISIEGDIVSSLSWDSANHLLTVNSIGGASEDIVFDGLGATLSYVAATGALQMKDASGNFIGEAINLPKEQFVTAGEYDAANKQIILYFDAEKTNSVTIDASALVDVYTGDETSSAAVSVSDGNVITATVKISTADGNVIELKEDGLYVSAPDLSDFMVKVPDAVEGNLVTLDASGQVVDSGKSFADLASAPTIFQGASLDEAVASGTPKEGDFAVISTPIGESDKVQKTAYQYDGTNWVAFDGNYSAENVFFPEDLTTTAAIGNITLTNGQATIKAAGKSLTEVWTSIFVKEKNPTSNTTPYVTLTANQCGKVYEVGETVTPTYTASFNAGKYQYGPATGIAVESWSVTDTNGGSSTSNSGSFDAFEVGEDTEYTITATATHTAGAIPVTNTGNDYATAQFKAGSKSKTSDTIKGYRKAFWGYSASLLSKEDITSAVIRGLQNSSDAAVITGSKFDVSFVAGSKSVIIAYPATVADMSTVIDTGAMNTPIQKAHDFTVDVEGANGYAAASYKVWIYNFAEGASADNVYEVTI